MKVFRFYKHRRNTEVVFRILAMKETESELILRCDWWNIQTKNPFPIILDDIVIKKDWLSDWEEYA